MSPAGFENWVDRGAGAAGRPGESSRGIALIFAVVTLVILSALMTGGLFVAAHHARIGYGESQAAAAFYAAESGLSATLAAWDSDLVTSVAPGGSMLARSARLASGAGFDAWLIRLDGGAQGADVLYLLASTGQAHGAFGGLRQLGLLLRAPNPARWCCEAAVTTTGDVQVDGDGAIHGLGVEPHSWRSVPGLCQGDGSQRAGILTDSEDRLRRSSQATLEGEPPLRALPAGLSNVTREIASAFRELAGRGDIVLPRGTRLDSVAPSLNTAGSCSGGRLDNWGEPGDPYHPCFDFLPVILAEGDLTIDGAGRGQGLLLVAGDLVVRGGFEFYGPVIVLGETSLQAGRILGSLLAPGGAAVRVAAGGQVGFSECAILRGLRSAKLVLPHPLAQFSWLEILE